MPHAPEFPGTPAPAPRLRVARGVHPYPPHREAEPGRPAAAGGRFTNLEPTPDRSRAELLRWQLGRVRPGEHGAWRAWVPVRQTVPPPRVTRGLRVTWVNHATALLQLDGRNLLVDPVWSDRVSPVPFAGPRRHHAPGVAFDALPPIDLVLLTHDHYDHLDLPTLRRLAARHGAPVVTGLGNAAYLAARGLPGAVELDWGDEVTLAAGGADEGAGDGAGDAPGALRATFVPARHWSARGASDRRRTLWGGFVVAGPAGRVYVAGDSGYGGHFAEAGARFGPFDLALLPIGAYRPEWFMAGHHMGPAEAVRAAAELRAAVSVPVHHGTFDLANDGQDEPVAELRRALAAAPDPPAFAVLAPGAAWASGAGVTGPDATGTEGADGWAP